ncbi:MAG: hypothetical protein ACLFU7_05620 [Armatimonadota bacterium]
MGRWKGLAIAAALAVAVLPAVGQGEEQTPAPEMPETPGDAAELYDEVRVLQTVRALELSSEQMAELVEINAGVIAQERELARLREATWEQYEDEIEAVLSAWMEGRTPSTRARNAADRAVNRVNDARRSYERARTAAARELYDALSGGQRNLVESPGVAEEREARTRRMGGIESVGEYVLTELDAIRDLMPDEFEMLAGAEARRIAEALVGSNAGNLDAMTDAVFDVLVDVYDWAPQRYQQQRSTLPQQIEEALGFESVDERAPVRWSELMRAATSSRTAAAARAIAAAGEGEVE